MAEVGMAMVVVVPVDVLQYMLPGYENTPGNIQLMVVQVCRIINVSLMYLCKLQRVL